MTDHIASLYAAVLALVAFVLTWAVIATKPWLPEGVATDPRVAALERREAELRRESVRLWRALELRRETEEEAGSASSVGIVSIPPLTSTRSS